MNSKTLWAAATGINVAAVDVSQAGISVDLVRLGIGAPHNGCIEIFSVATGTTLLLPVEDLRLLKDGLEILDSPCSSQRIVDLGPSS
ncbi:MAG: hypothetical protein RR983_02630 [Massilia sp.]|uniref:hypothetical protein n=1 Tax=Massilia sp. TaxID=1882437 RepID=UPI002FCAF4B0